MQDEKLIAHVDKRLYEMERKLEGHLERELRWLREDFRIIYKDPYWRLERRIIALEAWKQRVFRDPLEVIQQMFGLKKKS